MCSDTERMMKCKIRVALNNLLCEIVRVAWFSRRWKLETLCPVLYLVCKTCSKAGNLSIWCVFVKHTAGHRNWCSRVGFNGPLETQMGADPCDRFLQIWEYQISNVICMLLIFPLQYQAPCSCAVYWSESNGRENLMTFDIKSCICCRDCVVHRTASIHLVPGYISNKLVATVQC